VWKEEMTLRRVMMRCYVAAAERGSVAAKATEKMLEWPTLCRLVSSYAQTSKGRDDLRNMRPPATQAESEVRCYCVCVCVCVCVFVCVRA
jgi:hypothetical protein